MYIEEEHGDYNNGVASNLRGYEDNVVWEHNTARFHFINKVIFFKWIVSILKFILLFFMSLLCFRYLIISKYIIQFIFEKVLEDS